MSKHLSEYTLAELRALPSRAWNSVKVYDSIIIIPVDGVSESKWALIGVVGCIGNKPVEIATQCADNLRWKFPQEGYPDYFNTDMLMGAKTTRFWSNHFRFRVYYALSETDIEIIKK